MKTPSLPSSLIKPITALALLAAQPSIDAATYDWSGATSGNMSGTAANWGGTIPTGTDTASWNAASYTNAPTANANLTIGQLLFDAGNTGNLTFGSGNSTLTLNGISGTGIQMNSGSGAVSTGSARFAIGASQTWINNDNSLLTVVGAITNADNTTAKILTVDGTGNTTLSGVISNNTGGATTAITKNGTGTLAIGSASNNTFTGGLTLNAGTVSFGNTGSLGSGTVTVNGGTFVNTGGTVTTSTVTGWTLNSDLTYGVSAGAWTTGTGAVSLGAANIAINNNNTGTARTLTVNGTITGTSSLTLNTGGTSTTTLTSANNTGTITVLGSTSSETFTNITTMGSNVTSLTMGSANSGSTTTVSNIVVNSAGTTLSNNMTAGTGRVLKIGNTTGTGDLFINNNATVGTIMVQSTGTASSLGSINHTGNLAFGGTGNATWSGVNMNIGSNVVNVSKDHSAQLNLNGVNTYTGSTTVSKGALALTGSFASGGDYIANTGGSLYLDFNSGLATGSGNQSNKINTAAALQLGGGTLVVNGASNKAAVASASWISITTAGLPAGQVRLNFAAAPAVVVGQPITATGISAGSYVVRIDGNNVIVASSNTPAATGTDFAAAATTTTLSSQTFASTTLNAGASAVTATINGGSGTTIDLGGITRNVGSTLTVTTAGNTKSGVTTTDVLLDNGVAYATVGAQNWAGLSSGTFVNATEAALNTFDPTKAAVISNTVGALSADTSVLALRQNVNTIANFNLSGWTFTTGGILLGSGVSTAANGMTITGGTLKSAATAANKDLVIIQNGAGYLTINAVVADAAAGTTGLTKSGTGVLTLGGSNTFTGNTIVNQGNITLTNNLALQNSAVDTSGAGTITLSGTDTPTLGGLIGSKNLSSVITSGTSAVTSLTLNPGSAVTNTYSGVIANLGSGAMALNKSGAGTQILSGTNTYSGITTINAGTLLITGNSSSATGAVNVAAGATLGGNGTIGGAVTVAGSLNPGTASTLTLGSTLTFGSGSTLALTLGSNSSKIAFLSAGANLLGSGNATLSFTQDTGFDYGATYRIFENTSTTAFAFSSITGYDTSAYQAQFGFDSNNYNLTFTAVPEPSSYALLLFGLAGVIFARRRLRSR